MDDAPADKVDSTQVQSAYEAFSTLQKAARDNPRLLENEYFKALLDTGYSRFLLTFEAL